jgi:hypothetical protein
MKLFTAAVVATCLFALSACTSGESTTAAGESDSEYLQQEIDAAWQSYVNIWGPDEPRPTVAIERIIEQTDWSTVMTECIRGEGFPEVTATADGNFGYEGPASQTQAYDLAVYVCTARFPIDGKYYRPLDAAGLQKLYEFYVNDQSSCLEANGYQVADPPSLSQFVDTVGTPQGWAPYLSVSYSTQEEWERIVAACPQMPGADFYNGLSE